MRKIFTLILILNISITAQNNVTVEEVVQEVNQSSIMNYIRQLENFGTRFCLAPNRFEIANWIKSEFQSMGFESVVLDTFVMNTQELPHPVLGPIADTTTLQVNVVATFPGIETPERIFIIGGHYDSFCDNDNLFIVAPGADDNASGTACVLESARAVMEKGYLPKSTLVFIAFGAEELGYFSDLMGSEHYAYEAAARGDDIKLVINNDMIGFNTRPFNQASVNVGPTENFTKIDDVISICETYGSINFVGDGYCGADLWGFTEMGYDGIYFEESDFMIQFYLNYHKDTDISANIDSAFITEVIKGATGVLLSMEDVISSKNTEVYLPDEIALGQNYPNPFNPSTKINYSIPQRSKVLLKVYDVLGNKVAALVDEVKPSGEYQVEFSAIGGSASGGDAWNLSSGIYFYKLIAGSFVETKKMILLK